jgi:NAD/NADP transhydrogenase beta subunit
MLAKNIMINPSYGMAVAQAQHIVNEITKFLRNKGKKAGSGIHPVTGRMPEHMNVLQAKPKCPMAKRTWLFLQHRHSARDRRSTNHKQNNASVR